MQAESEHTSFQDKLVRFIRLLQSNWQRAEITSKAAEMAYYALLSMFPLLLVFVNIIPFLPLPQDEILSYVATALPSNVYDIIQPVLIDYLNSGSGGAISIGLLTAIWSASTVITVLRRVLDDVYGVESKQNVIVGRILSVAVMVLVILALGSVVFAVVFGEQIVHFTENLIGVELPLIQQLLSFRWLVLLLVLFVFFLLVYHVIPNHHIALKYSIPGAVFSTLVWLLLSQAFSLYLRFAGGDAVTNATFGGFIVLMLFLFLSGMVVFLGALVNAIYYEWKQGESVGEYEEKKQKEKELEKEGTTEYPPADTVMLRRKLVKVNPLNSEEVKERTKETQKKT